MAQLDTLIINGHIIDTFAGLDGRYDIGIKEGRIAGIYPPDSIRPASDKIVDIAGNFITAGWIDLHVHAAVNRAVIGIDADTVGVKQGVTTIVDAGSSGCKSFHDFEQNVIKKANTRVLAWLNVSDQGLYDGLSELADLSLIDEKEILKLINATSAIRGLKVRMSRSAVRETDVEGLRQAKTIAAKAGVPVMVHIGNPPPKLSDVLDLLDTGDIVTHIFHGKPHGCLDAQENLLPELTAALRRGIILDLGHGSESFSFRRMQQARALGLGIDTISTDIYSRNYETPVKSLVHTMEKCLALGMTLQEVIASVTLKPALVINEPFLGRLKYGAVADLTIFSVKESTALYTDSEGCQLIGKQRLHVTLVIKEGSIFSL